MTPTSFKSTLAIEQAAYRTRVQSEKWLRWIRSCSHCHSILLPTDFLCEECWSELMPLSQSGSGLLVANEAFPIFTLFTWQPEGDPWLRSLLYGMKGGHFPSAARRLLEEFSFQRCRPWAGGPPPCFVHPPAQRADGRDHSWLLAQTLRELLGGLSLGLKSAQSQEVQQKTLSVGGRLEIQFTTPETTPKDLPGQTPFIFVDDVVTTGATARAAYQALGEPDDFEVWALAYRPKLAGKSRF